MTELEVVDDGELVLRRRIVELYDACLRFEEAEGFLKSAGPSLPIAAFVLGAAADQIQDTAARLADFCEVAVDQEMKRAARSRPKPSTKKIEG